MTAAPTPTPPNLASSTPKRVQRVLSVSSGALQAPLVAALSSTKAEDTQPLGAKQPRRTP